MSSLKLYLLGRFEVVRADAPIPAQAWRRRRPADLLKLVALTPGRALARERAIDALWPDKDAMSGANNLHRALYDLRQILGGRWVDIERGQLTVRADVWLDVDAFEKAIAQGNPDGWAQAVALYKGDLSPEDVESPWLVERRAALRRRFVDAALPLARASVERGEPTAAIPVLRRLVDVDPILEEAQALLMRLLAEAGRRPEALRQYDACDAALRAAGLPGPSEETRALRAAIQRGELGPSRARPALDGARRAARRLLGTTEPLPIRGRGPVMLLVESLVEQGHGGLVLLGEPGVGKTRLAAEGARLAQARGAAVICGVAGAGGAPYGVFLDALAEEARLSPAAAAIDVPAAFGVGGEDVRLRVFDAVERALRGVAEGRPIYLLLDELHAADESSLNLLHLLARRAPALKLIFVATCDEAAIHAGTPIQMALAHLDCERLARGVRLPRLGLAATREQVADLLGEVPDEATVAQLYRVTDGSPLLTEEVLRAQREAGAAVPANPRAAIRARVERLGPRTNALLSAAAAAGARFEFEVIRPVSGLTAHEAALALEACLEARVLDEDGSGYRFHHALVRDVVYDAIPPGRRAALHGAIADALEAAASAQAGAEVPAEALARHRRLAGEPGRAHPQLVAAGHRAAARAGLREALGFYSEALRVVARADVPDGAARLELLDGMGRVQLALGELAGAARSFSEAARLDEPSGFRPSPEQRARAHRLAAIALGVSGHDRDAAAEIDAGLEAAGEAGGEEAAPLLHLRAQLLWHARRHAEALAAARACAARGAETGDADLFARGKDLEALVRAALGEPLAPVDDATGNRERSRQDPAPEHPVDVHLVHWDRDLLGDATAREVGQAAAALAERARQRDALDAVAAGRIGEGTAALAAGDLDVAEVALRDALARHRAAGSALGEALALERLGTLLTVRGRLDDALDLIHDGVVVAERASLRRHALARLHAAQARNRLAAGALYAAEDAVREASETAARHGECAACDAAFRPELVRVALARGRVGDADAEATLLEELARRRGGRVIVAVARLARARVLGARGRAEDALAALAAARSAFVAAGHRYEAARCVRLEARLTAGALPPELAALDALIVVDADA